MPIGAIKTGEIVLEHHLGFGDVESQRVVELRRSIYLGP